MISLSITLALIGFYMLYSTSERAKLILQFDFQKWVNKNKKEGKILGLILLFVSLMISMLSLGWAAGLFSFLVVIMTIASLVILVSPLRFFNLSMLIIIAILCFGVEFFIP